MWSSKISQKLILKYSPTKEIISLFSVVFETLHLPVSLEPIDLFQLGMLWKVALQMMCYRSEIWKLNLIWLQTNFFYVFLKMSKYHPGTRFRSSVFFPGMSLSGVVTELLVLYIVSWKNGPCVVGLFLMPMNPIPRHYKKSQSVSQPARAVNFHTETHPVNRALKLYKAYFYLAKT